MFIAAESRLGGFLVFARVSGELELEGAELVVDDLPNDLVGSHVWLVRVRLEAREAIFCVV